MEEGVLHYELRRRSREAEEEREAWRKVLETDGRRVGNREEEVGHPEEELGDKRYDKGCAEPPLSELHE